MIKGLGILFALFGGVPLFVVMHARDGPAVRGADWLDFWLSFLIVVSICYGIGALAGYAVRKMRTG